MKSVLNLIGLFGCVIVFGQGSVSHEVERDDPLGEQLQFSFDYFGAEFYTGNDERDIGGGAGLSVGFQLRYGDILDRLGVDLYYRRSYVTISTAAPSLKNTFFDAGITWDITRGTTQKANDVRLKEGGSTITFMKGVQMTRGDHFRLRAGLTTTSGAVEVPIKLGFVDSEAQMKSIGLYGGLEYAVNYNFKTIVNRFKPRRYQDEFRFYGDVIATPLGGYGDSLYASGFANANNVEIDEDFKNQLDSLNVRPVLGFRVGARYLKSWPSGLITSFDFYLGAKPPFTGVYGYLGCGLTYNFQTNFLPRREAKLEE